MRKLLVLICSAVGMLVGCAGSGPVSVQGGVIAELADIKTGSEPTRAALTQVGKDLAILHVTNDGRVALQLRDKRTLLDTTARVKTGGSYLQIHADSSRIQALWWSHQDGKNIYYAVSNDGGNTFSPVTAANDDHGVLPPFTLVNGTTGAVGLAYHDERLPDYEVFFNRSTDGGLTWPGPDIRQDVVPENGRSSHAFEPQLVKTAEQWLLAWTDNVPDAQTGRRFRLMLRNSLDEGKSWSSPRELLSAAHQITGVTMRANGEVAVIVGDELNAGVFSLVSTDSGTTWGRVGNVVSGSSGAINSGMRLSIAPSKDRAYLVWTEERGEAKPTMQAATIDLAKKEWVGPATRLDPKLIENTRSTQPTVFASKAGPVIAAWVDYRDIRPNIFVAVSHDQGATWSSAQAIGKSGLDSLGSPQIVSWYDGVAIAFERYPADKSQEGNLTVMTLDLGDSTSNFVSKFEKKASADENTRLNRLNERIEGMWKARVQGDFSAAYKYFDFAYKAVTPLKAYVDNSGVISYLNYQTAKIDVQGNVAAVDMKVRYEVKPVILPMTGKPISVAPFDADVPTKWVWIGDDWYFVYAPQFDPPFLRY